MKKGGWIFALFILAFANFISAAHVNNSIPIQIQALTDAGTAATGTFTFKIEISNSPTCSPVLYTNTTTATTDVRGVVSYNLEDVNLDFGEQYWFCYYRDGVLKSTIKAARVPYAFSAKNVTSSGINPDSNLDMGSYNISASHFVGDGSQLTGVALSGSANSSNVPVGTIIAYSGTTAPTDWLLCEGQNISRTDYSVLFGLIGTTFGAGDGSTTFTLPDLRGIFIRGAGTNSILKYANGSYFSSVLGSYKNDSLQGHFHTLLYSNSAELIAQGYTRSAALNYVAELANLGAGTIHAKTIITDGTNGVPRTGAETSPASLGLNYIIKVGNTNPDNFSDSNFDSRLTALESGGVSSIPAGMIAPFNLTSCPTGWVLADGSSGTPDLRGIFIRGSGTNSILKYANGSYFSSLLGSYKNDSFQGHLGITADRLYDSLNAGTGSIAGGGGGHAGQRGTMVLITDGTNGVPRTGAETSPAYYSTIYCVKTTEDSAVSNSILQESGGEISLANSSQSFIAGMTGEMKIYAGANPPSGWLLCNGSALDRTTYAKLFAVIGTTYGNTSATNFKIPDMRGIFARGAGTSGVIDYANGTDMSATLGSYKNDSLQGHSHNFNGNPLTINSGNTIFNILGSGGTSYYNAAPTGGIGSPITDNSNGITRTGAETSPAYLGVNYIIKY